MNTRWFERLFPNAAFKASRLPSVLAISVVLASGALSASAELVYVTAMTPFCTSTSLCGNGPNPEHNEVTGDLVFDDHRLGACTTTECTGAGMPATPGSLWYSDSFSNSTPDLGITLRPHLNERGALYQVSQMFSSSAGNVSSNVVLGVTNVANCTLSFTETDQFQSRYGNCTWRVLGYLTNAPGQWDPRITFYLKSGTVSAGLRQRLLVQCFRFISICPRCNVPPLGITGPLAVGLPSVTVLGVVTGATNITLYQNAGSDWTNLLSFPLVNPAATVPIPAPGLVKGAEVMATQTVLGNEGFPSTRGVIVGGGANPRIRLALSLREAPNATGPVGADGGAFTTNFHRMHFLGASQITGPLSRGPADGVVVWPSTNWQTITLQRGPVPSNPTNASVIWNSDVPGQGLMNDLQGDWGTLDGIALALDDPADTGPFDLYLDNFTNGGLTNAPQVIEDFEYALAGQADYTFRCPSFSGTTHDFIHTQPDLATVTSQTADTGTKSLRVAFQWFSLDVNNWLRLTTSSAPQGHPNPLVNLNDPITFRVLLLPPGSSPAPGCPPTLSVCNSNGQAILTWPGAHNLQAAPNLLTGFTNVPGITLAPYPVTPTAPQRFFRLAN